MSERVPQNIRELLESQVERAPDKEFLYLESNGQVFTYRAFNDEVNRAAATLLAVGVSKGDRVSLLLTNRAEYLIFYFACFKIGAWAGPVNALLKPKEIEFIIANSEAQTVVTQTDLLPHLLEAREHLSLLQNVILVEESGQWSVLGVQGSGLRVPGPNPEPGTPNADLIADDEALIIYTSGTTGKPKGVLLTHGNLLSNAKQIAEWLHLTADDRSLMIMPLFHVNALMTTAMAALWVGGSIVLAPRFSASRHWKTISRYGVTYAVRLPFRPR